MTKTIKAEYMPGGAKRQELLNQVPGYLRAPGFQGDKHLFLSLEKPTLFLSRLFRLIGVSHRQKN